MDTEGTGDVQGVGDTQQAYIADLKELRKEYGCTPERLRARHSLLAALRKRLSGDDQQQAISSCIVELKTTIEGLGDVEKREALLAALGLDERFIGRNLSDRREKYLATFETRRRPDIRTLQRWEDRAIESLAPSLAEDSTNASSAHVKSEEASSKKSITGGSYAITELDVAILWATKRDSRRYYAERRTIQAMQDGLDAWRGSHRYDADGLPDVKLMHGGQLIWLSAAESTVFMEVRFPEPLLKGGEHTFTLLRTQELATPFEGTYDYVLSPVVPIRKYTLRITFPDVRPSAIWSFSDLPRWAKPSQPDVGSRIYPNNDGQVEYIRKDSSIRLGYSYGLVWRF